MNDPRASVGDVDGIPVVWIRPDNQDGEARVALWLPWFSGTKEAAIPFLQELAGRGLTAVSFDPWQTFECGADDTHVPPDGALRFRDALAEAYPHAAASVRVTLHPGTGGTWTRARSPRCSRTASPGSRKTTPTPDVTAKLNASTGPARVRCT